MNADSILAGPAEKLINLPLNKFREWARHEAKRWIFVYDGRLSCVCSGSSPCPPSCLHDKWSCVDHIRCQKRGKTRFNGHTATSGVQRIWGRRPQDAWVLSSEKGNIIYRLDREDVRRNEWIARYHGLVPRRRSGVYQGRVPTKDYRKCWYADSIFRQVPHAPEIVRHERSAWGSATLKALVGRRNILTSAQHDVA